MCRFFIKTCEAAKFVLECLELMAGGEIFVPKMTEYSMLDLAKKMYPECEIVITGKGDGERCHEPLFADGEKPEEYPNYYVVDNLKDVL
jgi:UDP-N-acetylglucosamine 4,6-dehydratase/5-epimerase